MEGTEGGKEEGAEGGKEEGWEGVEEEDDRRGDGRV